MLKHKFRITDVTKNRVFMLVLYTLLALLLLALCSLLGSFVISAMDDPTANISVGAFSALLISAAVSGFGIARLAGKKPRLSVFAHICASAILLIFGIVFGGGMGGFMNALCYMGIASLSALLGGRSGGRTKRKFKR